MALLFAASGTAWGQQRAITIRDVSGEVGGGFDGSWFGFTTTESAKRLTYREWITLGVSGSLLHPRVLPFHVMVRPTRLQLDWSGPVTLLNNDGDRLDLNAGVGFLPGRPVSFSGRVLRTSGSTPGPFGLETDFETTEWAGDIYLRNPYLPVQLSYSTRSLKELVRAPARPQSIRQDANIQTVTFLAQNSKTRLFGERREYDDRAGPEDFTSHLATLDHRLRWGKKSRLLSSVRYTERTGTGVFDRISWEESLHLQHTWTVESDYRFGLNRTETPGNVVRGRFGDVGFTVRPAPQLMLGADFHGQSNRFTNGTQAYYRWGPRASWRATLPFQAQLAVGASLGFEQVRQDASDGRVPVVNEPHVIDPSGRFLLDNTDVVAGSVVFTDQSETTIYQSGFDYQLFPSGSLVEVLVLPGGRIATGDTVLVDYTFLIFPEGQTDALLGQYSASIGAQGITVYHRRSIREQENATTSLIGGVGSGGGSIVNIADRDDMTTGIRFTRRIGRASLNLLAERGRLESNEFKFLSTRVRGAVTVPLGQNLRSSVTADWSESESGDFTREIWNAGLTLEWQPVGPLRLRSNLAAWRWTETSGNRQRFVGGGIEADWRYRRLSIQLRYDHNAWRESFENTENRLYARVVRSF